MDRFEPIAVVGQACLLPGATSPAALWDLVSRGASAITSAPENLWGLPHDLVMGSKEDSADRTWSDKGGYVQGFEQLFQPDGFALPAA